MERIIDGTLYEGKVNYGFFDIRVWEQGGHREISARNTVEWVEVGPVPPRDAVDPERDKEWLAEQAEKALRRSAKRAQVMCRRIIKAEGFNELLTLTYRENMTDRARAWRDLKEWVRRMKRALGGEFRYCGAPERQERGAYHWHIACHKLPQHVERKKIKVHGWRLGTVIWRSIVGADNGLCFVGGKPSGQSRKAAKRSPAKMAAYVAKYILKDSEATPFEANRYSRSNGIAVRKSIVFRWSADSLAEVMGRVCELFAWEGDQVVSHRMGKWADHWWLCLEPPTVGVDKRQS
jgi:hypothetical protein